MPRGISPFSFHGPWNHAYKRGMESYKSGKRITKKKTLKIRKHWINSTVAYGQRKNQCFQLLQALSSIDSHRMIVGL